MWFRVQNMMHFAPYLKMNLELSAYEKPKHFRINLKFSFAQCIPFGNPAKENVRFQYFMVDFFKPLTDFHLLIKLF